MAKTFKEKAIEVAEKGIKSNPLYIGGKAIVDSAKTGYDQLKENVIDPAVNKGSYELRTQLNKAELAKGILLEKPNAVQKKVLETAGKLAGQASKNEKVQQYLVNSIKNDPIGTVKNATTGSVVGAALLNPYDTSKYLVKQGMNEAEYQWNKLTPMGKVGVGAAGLAGIGGLGYLGYRMIKNKKDKKEDQENKKMKKSFSEEFCEDKALISAANTVDMITLIDPVNYSEYSAGLVSKITSTPIDYVVNVMNEVADFNAHFSEGQIDLFIDQVSGIYEYFSEPIVQNYSEYLNSLTDFDESSAEAKIEDLSDLISLMDEDTIRELGTNYVASVISSATDTDIDLLENTLKRYLASDEKTEAKVEKAEEKTEDAAKATEDAKDAVQEEVDDIKVAQESFSEVFIKKDGEYYKFNDAVVTVPVKE